MTEKKNVPRLRFPCFADEWEQRKFEKITNRVSKSSGEKGLVRVEYEDIVSGQGKLNKDLSTKSSDKRGIEFEVGDVLFGKLRPYLQNWLFADFKGIAVGDWWVLRSENHDAKFVYSLIQGDKYQLVANLSTGTKMPRSDWNVVSNTDFFVPKDIEEQAAIGSFFATLDRTIAIHQRKLEKTKSLKAAYLAEMFPAEGECKPKRRFAGFTDDWEQRKLGDVANHRGGLAIEKYFDANGKYKVISIGSYGLDSIYVDQGIRAISNQVTDERVINKGELAMVLNDKTSNGAIIGRSLLISTDDEYAINQRTEIISPKANLDASFAYVMLNGPFRERVRRIVQGGTQIYVNYPSVENLTFELPSLEEQQKIGAFFATLDATITSHQHKLEKLQNLKKAYLNEMFV